MEISGYFREIQGEVKYYEPFGQMSTSQMKPSKLAHLPSIKLRSSESSSGVSGWMRMRMFLGQFFGELIERSSIVYIYI